MPGLRRTCPTSPSAATATPRRWRCSSRPRPGAHDRQPHPRVVHAQRVDLPAVHAGPPGRGHGRLRGAAGGAAAGRGTLQSPLSSILEIDLWRGDLDEARWLLAIYHRMEESDDVQERAGYAGAKACLRCFEGRYDEAVEPRASIRWDGASRWAPTARTSRWE